MLSWIEQLAEYADKVEITYKDGVFTLYASKQGGKWHASRKRCYAKVLAEQPSSAVLEAEAWDTLRQLKAACDG